MSLGWQVGTCGAAREDAGAHGGAKFPSPEPWVRTAGGRPRFPGPRRHSPPTQPAAKSSSWKLPMAEAARGGARPPRARAVSTQGPRRMAGGDKQGADWERTQQVYSKPGPQSPLQVLLTSRPQWTLKAQQLGRRRAPGAGGPGSIALASAEVPALACDCPHRLGGLAVISGTFLQSSLQDSGRGEALSKVRKSFWKGIIYLKTRLPLQ